MAGQDGLKVAGSVFHRVEHGRVKQPMRLPCGKCAGKGTRGWDWLWWHCPECQGSGTRVEWR